MPASIPATHITFEGRRGLVHAVHAHPVQPKGAVLVIHENRGLTSHFVDLAGRFAALGYTTLCVDLASAEGGSAALGSEDAVREMLGRTARDRLLDDVRSGIDKLQSAAPKCKLAIVGFCFGGAITWELLAGGEPRLSAAAAFYGRCPVDPDFSGSKDVAVLGVYAGLDEGVNSTRAGAEAALRSAGVVHRTITLEGAEHAFFNDTGARFHSQAAAESWTVLSAWLAEHLA